ncbi:MAG: NF038122 family metalloprotease, partial [Planctomycetota bacterium]
ATAIHEIGHALGFNSGVDFVDLVFSGAVPFFPPRFLVETPVIEPLDLFRYSTASAPQIDLTPGGDPYFSIDGGATALTDFATGEFLGDGDQASHWQDAALLMSGRLAVDELQDLTRLDLMAMDVIGWDLARIPEPSTLILACLLVFAHVATRVTSA